MRSILAKILFVFIGKIGWLAAPLLLYYSAQLKYSMETVSLAPFEISLFIRLNFDDVYFCLFVAKQCP